MKYVFLTPILCACLAAQTTYSGKATLGVSATTLPIGTLSPTSLNFGSVPENTLSSALILTLTNVGVGILEPSSVAFSGTNAQDFYESDNCTGATLSTNQSCQINISFLPRTNGQESATFSISDDGSGSPHTASLTGSGYSGNPAVSLSASSLSFGSERGSLQYVVLTNTGTGALSLSGITLGGTNSGDFVSYNNCGLSVAPGANCSIAIGFTPTATGSRSASVLISDNATGTPQSFTISATSSNKTVYIDPVNGSDSASGTKTAPYQTFNHASRVNPSSNMTFLLRSGYYISDDSYVWPSMNNAWIGAYPGETPTFSGNGLVFDVDTPNNGVTFNELHFWGVNVGEPIYIGEGTPTSYVQNVSVLNSSFTNATYEWLRFDPFSTNINVIGNSFDTNGYTQAEGAGGSISLIGANHAYIGSNYFARSGHYAVEEDCPGTTQRQESDHFIIDNNTHEAYWGGSFSNTPCGQFMVAQNNRITRIGVGDAYPKTALEADDVYSIYRNNIIAYQSGWYGNEALLIFSRPLGPTHNQTAYNYVYHNDFYDNECFDIYLDQWDQSGGNGTGSDIPVTNNRIANNIFSNEQAATCFSGETFGDQGSYVADYTTAYFDSSSSTWTPSNFDGGNYVNNNILENGDSSGFVYLLKHGNTANPWTLAYTQSTYPSSLFGNIQPSSIGLVNPGEPQSANFALTSTSPARAAGSHLTTTTTNGTSTTTVPVADAQWFTDGMGLMAGDTVKIGSNAAVQVTTVYPKLDTGELISAFLPNSTPLDTSSSCTLDGTTACTAATYLGWQFTVMYPVTVSKVGMWCVAANNSTETVGLATGGSFITNGTASVNMNGCTPGTIVDQSLSVNVTLTPGTVYQIVFQNVAGQSNTWYGLCPTYNPQHLGPPIQSEGPVWSTASTPTSFTIENQNSNDHRGCTTQDSTFGPVSFTFTNNNPQNELIVSSPRDVTPFSVH